MSIPQAEERKLKRFVKDDARNRIFKDIEELVKKINTPYKDPIPSEEEIAKESKACWAKLRELVDTYAAVETTPLTKERMNEAWARMKKNG